MSTNIYGEKFDLAGRRNYLGETKGARLGGCSIGGDAGTYYPIMWKNIIEKYNIKTFIDIGCGYGWAVKYFHDSGCDAIGIDGHVPAIEGSPVSNLLSLHDYHSGPCNVDKEFDIAWSCEFVEHVEEQYAPNFIETFKSAKILAITYAFPGQTGHHHVNEQYADYWIDLLSKNDFEYDEEMTKLFKSWATLDQNAWLSVESENTDQSKYQKCIGWHFPERGLVFKNKRYVDGSK